jgi:hypothetical protein
MVQGIVQSQSEIREVSAEKEGPPTFLSEALQSIKKSTKMVKIGKNRPKLRKVAKKCPKQTQIRSLNDICPSPS